MPINYSKPGMKRPGVVNQWTQEQVQELIKCGKDILYFAEKYYTIVHPRDGEMLITLHDFQKEMLKNFQNHQNNVVLSARQVGKTTCSGIFILWFALFNDNKFIAILANKQLTAKSIIDEIKYAWERLPDWLKPGVIEYNALAIKFDNGCDIMAAPTSPDAIRGQSVSLLFLDEFAFVPENMAEDFWKSNYPTVASNGGKIIVVSTPKGTGGKFYKLYTEAESGQNAFKSIKVAWDRVPGRDEAWKEKTIAELGLIGFNQEHNCSFTGSTSTLINGDTLATLKTSEPVFMLDEGYVAWRKRENKKMYAFGVDVGQGANSDYSTINIFDITDYPITGKYDQVALYRRNDLGVFEFEKVILKLAKEWNDALVIVENNGTGLGAVVVKELYFEDGYENAFFDAEKAEYGINANKKTKALALTFFKADIEEKRMKIVSKQMVTELSYFEEQKDGVYAARKGNNFHDDTVSSGYWVSYMLRQPWALERIQWFLEQIGKGKINKNTNEEMDEGIADAFTSGISSYNPQAEFDMELWRDDE
jgi:hypothetical protein